jgi:hypothetical protein
MKKILIVALLFLNIACSNQDNKQQNQKIVAKVGNRNLTKQDLIGLVALGSSKKDSASIVQRYIENWVNKQIMLQKAEKEIKLNQNEIDKKLTDYKNDLILYEFEKNYIQKNLDTTVKQEQIKNYYEENPANFELKQNIVKGVWAKVRKDNKEANNAIKELLIKAQYDPQKIKSELPKNSAQYKIFDENWIDIESIIKDTPFHAITNRINFIQTNRFSENTDEEYTHFLLINAYKVTNQLSPIEFVKPRIINMLLNQRKIQLLKNMEKNIYEEAKKNKLFQIYK